MADLSQDIKNIQTEIGTLHFLVENLIERSDEQARLFRKEATEVLNKIKKVSVDVTKLTHQSPKSPARSTDAIASIVPGHPNQYIFTLEQPSQSSQSVQPTTWVQTSSQPMPARSGLSQIGVVQNQPIGLGKGPQFSESALLISSGSTSPSQVVTIPSQVEQSGLPQIGNTWQNYTQIPQPLPQPWAYSNYIPPVSGPSQVTPSGLPQIGYNPYNY
jgi:hypothetical protein